MGVSAVVITKDEERVLDRCLRSLAFADEIVVLDSYSTDRTPEIARQYTGHFHQRVFTGFSDQRNAAIALADQEWVLFVDADEVVTDALAAEIMDSVRSGQHDGYRIPRLTYFLGVPIRHCGWRPDYVLRLGKREKLYVPDRLVHEAISVRGTTASLSNELLHYSYRSISDFFHKTEQYNLAAARQRMLEGHSFRLSDLLFRPPYTFLTTYVGKLGFLDGVHGLVLCTLMSCSVAFRYAMLWEMSRLESKENGR